MSQTRQESSSSSVIKSLLYGSVAGGAEVLCDHPFWTMKTRAQKNLPFTTSLSVLYRGLVPNMLSMMPITALQFGLNATFKSVLFGEKMSVSEQLVSACMSGAGAAIVACPTERVMTRQVAGMSFTKTAVTIVQQGGARSLYAGLMATALRDGGFTAGIFVGAPYMKGMLMPYIPSEKTATLAGSISAGVVVAVVTQAIDTIKTEQQSSEPNQSLSVPKAAKKLYSENGVGTFFRGTHWRAGRVASGVTIMSMVGDQLVKKFG
jgi:hypothetical protein